MKRNQTDLRDECPKCGASSYQGGYCFRCGTYRPSKHNERAEELDAAAFVEGGFANRVNYADDEALLDADDLDIPGRKPRLPMTSDTPKRKPKKQGTHPPSQPEPAKPPGPRVKHSHLLQPPDLSVPELKRKQTDLGDMCAKCGAISYIGGYCFGCGTYRPSVQSERDEDSDIYADDEALLNTDDVDDLKCRPTPQGTDGASERHLKKKDLPPNHQPDPGNPTAPRVKRSHLLQRPDLSIPESIDLYNRRADGPAIEQLRTDYASPPCTPQSSATVDPSLERPPKQESSIQIKPEPASASMDVLENRRESESLGTLNPDDVVQQPAPIPLRIPKVPEIGSSQPQPAHSTKPQRIFSRLFSLFAGDLFKFVFVMVLTILVFSLLIRLFR